ncbi:MAG: DNA polymerase III subunit delta [Blautia sp.]|nr:DNA polymerase III subunit delta [Blautia sp.]
MSVKDDIRKNEFSQLYLLYGEEKYLLLNARKELLSALVPEGEEINFARYEGKDISIPKLIDFCETMPFFADRRVALLENTGFFKNKCDELADYLPSLPSYMHLVFVEEQVDKRSRMYKAVNSRGQVFVYDRLSEEKLLQWLSQFLNKQGRKITRQDASYLLAHTGNDMENIRNELLKLISFTEGRDVVSLKDIDAVCSTQTMNKIFDMVTAVANRDQKLALRLYQDLLTLKEPPLRILFLLARQFNQLLQIKQMEAEGIPGVEIAKVLKVQDYIRKKLSGCARAYTAAALRQAVKDFVEAEEAVKTGQLSDILSVELLIMKYSSRQDR